MKFDSSATLPGVSWEPLAAEPAASGACPSKPIRIIVPVAATSATLHIPDDLTQLPKLLELGEGAY